VAVLVAAVNHPDFAQGINPFSAAAGSISGLKKYSHTHTAARNVFDGPTTNLFSILCILIEIVSRAYTLVGKKTLKVKVHGY